MPRSRRAPQKGIPQGLQGAGSPAGKMTLKIAAVSRGPLVSLQPLLFVFRGFLGTRVHLEATMLPEVTAPEPRGSKQDRKEGARSGSAGGKGVGGFLEGLKCLVKQPHSASER